MRSLQSRLGVGLVLSLVALFALQWVIVGGSIRYLIERHVASRLDHDAESLLAALTFGGPSGGPSLDPERIAPVYKRPFSGHYFQIAGGGGKVRSRSLWDQELALPDVAVGQSRQSRLIGPQRQPLLVVSNGYRKHDRTVTISVAEDLSPLEASIRSFQWRYGLISAAILAVLIATQRVIVRRGLSPLERARRQLTALERGESTRLDDAAPAEIQPLIRQINRLLDAMTQRLQRSRHAVGNLAHAMKAPLTVLRQLAEQDDGKTDRELRRQLIEQTRALQSLAERELTRARLAGPDRPGQAVVVREEVDQLLDALAKIHRDKAVAVDCAIAPNLTIAADREDFLELLGNLLDNAFKWSRGRVRLSLEHGDGITIVVEDDGPGCSPEECARIAERGVRTDESASGHGIGLAIVREVVEQYGGTMVFGRSERLGGFEARVTLPLRGGSPSGGR